MILEFSEHYWVVSHLNILLYYVLHIMVSVAAAKLSHLNTEGSRLVCCHCLDECVEQ